MTDGWIEQLRSYVHIGPGGSGTPWNQSGAVLSYLQAIRSIPDVSNFRFNPENNWPIGA